MIFVTVGTELPFDRLVRAVDDWAHEQGRDDVFAQIGQTTWRPSFIPYAEFLDANQFNLWFARSSVVIAHAGMGTILSALRYGKPILVMPRRASLREHRNEHQLATVKQLLELDQVHVAVDECDLRERLQHIDNLPVRARTGAYASPTLLTAIRGFVQSGEAVRKNATKRVTAPASGQAQVGAMGGQG